MFGITKRIFKATLAAGKTAVFFYGTVFPGAEFKLSVEFFVFGNKRVG